MLLDMNGIVSARIEKMQETGELEKRIEDGVEKLISSAIDSAFSDYNLKRELQKSIEKEVGDIASKVGFSAYNTFIATKLKEIIEGVMREDVTEKINATFENLLVQKHEPIKISQVFGRYREWVMDDTAEDEKEEYGQFTCSWEAKEDGKFTHYTIKFSREKLESYGQPDISIRILTYGENIESSEISGLTIDGHDMNKALRLHPLTHFETLLLNLYYNKTPIVLDFENVDDSNDYIDY